MEWNLSWPLEVIWRMIWVWNTELQLYSIDYHFYHQSHWFHRFYSWIYRQLGYIIEWIWFGKEWGWKYTDFVGKRLGFWFGLLKLEIQLHWMIWEWKRRIEISVIDSFWRMIYDDGSWDSFILFRYLNFVNTEIRQWYWLVLLPNMVWQRSCYQKHLFILFKTIIVIYFYSKNIFLCE